MEFFDEYAVQAFINYVVGGVREVSLAGNGRIDILSDQLAIEVKPWLEPSAIDLAAGQLARYGVHVGGRRRIIAGLTPKNYSQAVMDRAAAQEATGVEVWFIDQMPEFSAAYGSYFARYGSKDPTRGDGIQGNTSAMSGGGVLAPIGQYAQPPIVGASFGGGSFAGAYAYQGQRPMINHRYVAPPIAENAIADILVADAPQKTQFYKADDMVGVYLAAAIVAILFSLISLSGLGFAYHQGKMPIRTLEIIFRR